MTKIGHLGEDSGAHHVLPGFRHPEQDDHDFDDHTVGEPPESEHAQGDRAKALIGTGAGVARKIWYDPDMPNHRLPNEHMTITGESGSGKTQAMKTIMADLHDTGVPALVLDFKDDYADPEYSSKEGFTVYDPTQQALPLNPLQPPADHQGMVNTTFHTYQLTEIISRIYRLGDLQSFRLREAIKQVYKDANIPEVQYIPPTDQVWPPFQAVKDKLADTKDTAEILGRMSPMFDFGFFASADPKAFGSIAESNTVIRLGQLPGNEVKNSVAEFFLMALYNHLIRLPQVIMLKRILVLDEAWRLVNSPFLEPLMREGRAFGLGVFVATQFPTDLPQTVSGSAATQIFFGQSTPQQVSEIEKIITGSTSSVAAERIGTVVRGLLPLTCVLYNKQYTPYVKVEARPYYARSFEEVKSVESSKRYATKAYCWDCGWEGEGEFTSGPSDDGRYTYTYGPACPNCGEEARSWNETDALEYCDQGHPGHPAGTECDSCRDEQLASGLPRSSGRENFNQTKHLAAKRCERCGGITKNSGGICKACEVQESFPITAEKVNPHTPQAEVDRADYWWKGNGGEAGAATEQDFMPGQRKYQEQVDGKYICQCGFQTDNEPREEDNWQPLCDYCKTIGNLSGMPQGDDPSASRPDKYRNWWKQEAGKQSSETGVWWPVNEAATRMSVIHKRHPDDPKALTLCNRKIRQWGSVDAEGSDFLTQKKCSRCWGDKTAEMQKFPPGEDDNEGNPFAPFSMSEWQMVKGPKLKGRGKTAGIEDDPIYQSLQREDQYWREYRNFEKKPLPCSVCGAPRSAFGNGIYADCPNCGDLREPTGEPCSSCGEPETFSYCDNCWGAVCDDCHTNGPMDYSGHQNCEPS